MNRLRCKPLRLALEALESRHLLSPGGVVLPFRAAAVTGRASDLGSVSSRPDLDAFARRLARHPRQAARLGLGGWREISTAMRGSRPAMAGARA